MTLDVGLDKADCVRVHAQVIRPKSLVLTVDGQHLLDTDFAQRERLEARGSLETQDLVLADSFPVGCIGLATCQIVIDEEGVESASVDENAGRVDCSKSPGTLTGRVYGVVVGRLSCVGRVEGVWCWLVVWRLSLNKTRKNVCRLVELVLVQSVMLYTVCPQPSASTFHQKTTACEDGDTGGGLIVKIMVRRPEPVVL